MPTRLTKTKKHPSRQNIKIAVDNCIFTIKNNQLQILLIQMEKEPPKDKWALPGGLIDGDETLDQAAKRILKQETGVNNVYLEQLYTFSQLKRDPFGRVISCAYFALIPNSDITLRTTPKYSDVKWWPINNLARLAYDHNKIARSAHKRLQAKISHTNVVWSLLPPKFAFSDLQKVYEIILSRKLDKRNFRKKILSLGIIDPVKEKILTGAHRPATLYQFKNRRPENIAVI